MFLKIKRKINPELDIKSFTDEELIAQYKNTSDNNIFSELFDRYTHLIFGVCMKYLKNEAESKDAVMQVFEQLFTKLKTQEIQNFKNWIYTVAKNFCLMKIRYEQSLHKHKDEYYANIQQEIMESTELFHPLNKEELNDRIPKLKKGIEQLKSDQRRCIELLYLQEKSYKEVVNITGYSMKQVKSYIQNGKRNLKIFLENE
ncbi:MAG: RNA polymerase subunit sigma-24 [Candidatus Cloacimonadota bacterium]|nr:MAG: RNA polymerase subunit sigma-24 [Candidatus Cloacimonadota bacterium]